MGHLSDKYIGHIDSKYVGHLGTKKLGQNLELCSSACFVFTNLSSIIYSATSLSSEFDKVGLRSLKNYGFAVLLRFRGLSFSNTTRKPSL